MTPQEFRKRLVALMVEADAYCTVDVWETPNFYSPQWGANEGVTMDFYNGVAKPSDVYVELHDAHGRAMHHPNQGTD